ncbi:MAG: (2Fe-2S)-binding protein [Acetatifactor sp.]|nr:(2Fe-2S)-binding protein [Acetatifactor sp.]
MPDISFVLNGKETSYAGSATERLLDVLHNSCCVAIGAVVGSCVVTLEGYRETERYAVMDKAFADVSAVQCGFCTPGMILAAEALLSKNPHPDETEIREGLSGNLCRCTGYNAIIRAVQKAAEEGNGLW